MGRWFFEGLKKCVKSSFREHVYLIYDVDFEFSLRWCEFGMVDNFTNIIDTSVACCIYLYNIDHTTCVIGSTIRANMTRVPFCGYGCTIDCFCKYTSERRLSNTMKSEKYVTMMKCLSFTGIAENFFYKILTDDIGEIFWTIGLIERHDYLGL